MTKSSGKKNGTNNERTTGCAGATTINEMFQSLCSEKLMPVFIRGLAESTGTSYSSFSKYLNKNGHLAVPTITEMGKAMLANPELAKAMAKIGFLGGFGAEETEGGRGGLEVVSGEKMQVKTSSTADGGLVATISTTTGMGFLESMSQETTLSDGAGKKKKRKSKTRKKKNSSVQEIDSIDDLPKNVARPRNFLEAALYFSTITQSTVEMASRLEPAAFFAPPILFPTSSLTAANFGDMSRWADSFKKEIIGVIPFESQKTLQRRTVALFAVGLLQMAQHLKSTAAERTSPGLPPSTLPATSALTSVAVRSNFLKRTIGLYAMSLVDHLPPSLTCRLSEAERALGPLPAHPKLHNPQTTSSSLATMSHAQRLLFKNNPLLANRKLELNDLKVPSAQQLVQFWNGLAPAEQIEVIRGEQTALTKGWVNVKKHWCLCKYCRTRSLRIGDIFELLYRLYYDDLEKMVISIVESMPERNKKAKDANVNTNGEVVAEIKGKTRKHFYISLSLLTDDIVDEKGTFLVSVLKRLGRAFEDDDNSEWYNADEDNGEEEDEEADEREEDDKDLVTGNREVFCTKDSAHKHVNGTDGCREVCDCCRKSFQRLFLNKINDHFKREKTDALPDEMSDSEDEEDAESSVQAPMTDEEEEEDVGCDDEAEDLETFYEDFNLLEDEEIIQAECELPVDLAHLSTTFPTLYDTRLYQLPRPYLVKEKGKEYGSNNGYYDKYANDNERAEDGNLLYEHLASLLFQFHLVPRYLEADALERQQRLLEEEEEQERLERERAEQKLLAKQRKREKAKAAKKAKKLALEEASVEDSSATNEGAEAKWTGDADATDTINDEVNDDDEKAGNDKGSNIIDGSSLEALGPNEDAGAQETGNDVHIQDDNRESDQHAVDDGSNETREYGDEDDEVPPGLVSSFASLENLDPDDALGPESTALRVEQPSNISGEAPIGLPSTWFDQILGQSLWSPLATASKLGDELPPGFSDVYSPIRYPF